MELQRFLGEIGLPATPYTMQCQQCPGKKLRVNVGVTNLGEPCAWAWCRDCRMVYCPYGDGHVRRFSKFLDGRTEGHARKVVVCLTDRCQELHKAIDQNLARLARDPLSAGTLQFGKELKELIGKTREKRSSHDWRRIYWEFLGRVWTVQVKAAKERAFVG
jgi:hypothetical protein